jgi:hypothetical protein
MWETTGTVPDASAWRISPGAGRGPPDARQTTSAAAISSAASTSPAPVIATRSRRRRARRSGGSSPRSIQIAASQLASSGSLRSALSTRRSAPRSSRRQYAIRIGRPPPPAGRSSPGHLGSAGSAPGSISS